jgi:hypothetical protein
MIDKIRVSFSILNSWSKGYAQDAIDMYFKNPREDNKFMIDGVAFHKTWQEYIDKHKKLHPQLSSLNKPLICPQTELKLEMDITPDIQLVGVIDCLDESILYEFKSGTKPSSEYANTNQADVYSLLCEHHGYKPTKAFYLHFDQYLKETDSAMVWLTEERRQKAKEWVIKQANSFRDYLTTNKLFEKYKKTEDIVLIEEMI